jgi:hypothetical protein
MVDVRVDMGCDSLGDMDEDAVLLPLTEPDLGLLEMALLACLEDLRDWPRDGAVSTEAWAAEFTADDDDPDDPDNDALLVVGAVELLRRVRLALAELAG